MNISKYKIIAAVLPILALGPVLASSDQAGTTDRYQALAEDILGQAISIRSVDDGSGSTVEMAKAMARRLTDAGFPAADVLVTGPRPNVGVVVARYRGDGTGGKPIIVMAHMDVVDAKPSDWTRDPFRLEQDDTFFYGRGVGDDKGGVVMLVTNFIRLHEEGYKPNRDIIMVLTGDEETTGSSMIWLANEKRSLIDADYALNTDAGEGVIENGKRVAFAIQTSEKMYQTFTITARNPGGHSSVPRPDNAIYQLMHGLERLETYQFPVSLNKNTAEQFMATADVLGGQTGRDLVAVASGGADAAVIDRLSSDPYWNAMLRTTCVATMLGAGHAENALPQSATATVNCRIFPGVSADDVEAKLQDVVDLPDAEFKRLDVPHPSGPSPLRATIMEPIKSLVKEHFGEVPVIPSMETGATDGLFLRNVGIPVYGVSAVFAVEGEMNFHGMNEKVRKKSFFDALSFWHDMLKALTGGGA